MNFMMKLVLEEIRQNLEDLSNNLIIEKRDYLKTLLVFNQLLQNNKFNEQRYSLEDKIKEINTIINNLFNEVDIEHKVFDKLIEFIGYKNIYEYYMEYLDYSGKILDIYDDHYTRRCLYFVALQRNMNQILETKTLMPFNIYESDINNEGVNESLEEISKILKK